MGILQDLCGPKIRVGEMTDGKIMLADGEETVIAYNDVVGTANAFSCSYKSLARDAEEDDRILLNDGLLELKVIAIEGNNVRCKVVHGGILRSSKGMNLPGMKLSTPSVTAKDIDDLKAGLDMGVDFVGLSFVRKASDLDPVKDLIALTLAKAKNNCKDRKT